MERITKIVTREEEFYVARDGKEFSDESECLYYENELNIKSLETYDENFNRVSFEYATYIVIHSDEEVNIVNEICNYNGWNSNGLCGVGFFRYNCDYRFDKWEKVKIPNFLKDFVEFI